MDIFDFNGVIGIDVLASEVSAFLKDKKDVKFNIATPGGLIDEALLIFNLINSHDAKTVCTLMGTVASAGSYVSSAFDDVEVHQNAVFMIHNAIGGAWGDYKVLRKESDVLEKFNPHMAKAYIAKTGKTKSEIVDLMEKETWLFGDEIVKNGFGDKIISGKKKKKENVLKAATNDFKEMYQNLQQMYGVESLKRAAILLDDSNSGDSPLKNNNKKNGVVMNKEELLKHLKNFKANGEITLPEIAKALGLENQLVTEEQKAALKAVNSISKKLDSKDVVLDVEKMLKDREESNKIDRENKLTKEFGPEKHEDGKLNELRLYASDMILDVSDKAIENFKKHPIAQKLAAERADESSDINLIGNRTEKKNSAIGGSMKI